MGSLQKFEQGSRRALDSRIGLEIFQQGVHGLEQPEFLNRGLEKHWIVANFPLFSRYSTHMIWYFATVWVDIYVIFGTFAKLKLELPVAKSRLWTTG